MTAPCHGFAGLRRHLDEIRSGKPYSAAERDGLGPLRKRARPESSSENHHRYRGGTVRISLPPGESLQTIGSAVADNSFLSGRVVAPV